MENATKALIIAAAVLVAIIIISLTLGVVRQGQETISSADMSQAEMDAYNAKFTMYEGNNVSTAEVNALLNTVLIHNQNRNPIKDKTVSVSGIYWSMNESHVTKLTGSSYYTVKCIYYNDGLVGTINVTKNP